MFKSKQVTKAQTDSYAENAGLNTRPRKVYVGTLEQLVVKTAFAAFMKGDQVKLLTKRRRSWLHQVANSQEQLFILWTADI